MVLSSLARTAAILACLGPASLALGDAPPPVPTPVRHPEGLVHGYLALRTLQGETLADGDLLQNVRGDDVTSRLVFHFKDGSIHDETAVFSQRRHFRVLSYRLTQKGPAFPRTLEVSIDTTRGEVTVRHSDDDGEQKVETDRRELPLDLANGLVPILLKNGRPGSLPTMSFLAATPKPRLVRLEVAVAGEDPFVVAGSTRKAIRYVVKVEIGGLAGVFAGLLGKQPPDTHVWIQAGEAPGFLKSEGPLYPEGPTWRIELTSPSWRQDGS
jgi:hypothetical protein